jgi:hypothetical protein
VERFQPALRGLSQVVEGSHGRLLPISAWRPLRSGRKKVRGRRIEPNGWEGLPCRGQEAPQCALQRVSPTAAAVSTAANTGTGRHQILDAF